jgi:hypothetical protein
MAEHVWVDREWHLGGLADALDEVEADGADWPAALGNEYVGVFGVVAAAGDGHLAVPGVRSTGPCDDTGGTPLAPGQARAIRMATNFVTSSDFNRISTVRLPFFWASLMAACTPASGWEKGQVENQVGLVRERFFTPRLRFKTYDEMNAWLLDKCIAYAKAHRHPELTEQTIWEVFEAERPRLVPYAGRFDGFHAMPASVSKTCLVRFDNNKYSVAAIAVGRPVEVYAYADRIVIRQNGRIVGEHPRSFSRGDTVYDPWHYVPVLARKPGALRNGAPFKDWVLPAAMERVRRKLASADDGNRQMVDILTAVLTDGLPAVEAACAEAIAHGVHSADVVLNILARQRDPAPPATILTPAALTLRHAPIADCARYDNLRRTI